MITINVKIVGHELVETKEPSDIKGVPPTVYDMLHVKMRGVGSDKKTRATLVVDPNQREKFPLGDKGEIGFKIPQQRLDIGRVLDKVVDKVVDEVNSGALDTGDTKMTAART